MGLLVQWFQHSSMQVQTALEQYRSPIDADVEEPREGLGAARAFELLQEQVGLQLSAWQQRWVATMLDTNEDQDRQQVVAYTRHRPSPSRSLVGVDPAYTSDGLALTVLDELPDLTGEGAHRYLLRTWGDVRVGSVRIPEPQPGPRPLAIDGHAYSQRRRRRRGAR